MNDKKDIKKDEVPEIEVAKKSKKVKVEILANIKYGESLHSIGEKIYILASEVKEFEALKLVKKVVFEKEEIDPEEGE
jgi:hypothetical protein